LGSDQTGAYFLTAFGTERRQAVIKLVPADPSTAEQQLAWWHRTKLLSQPHVLPLLDCGHTETDDGALLYAVFEYPDDNVAAALQRGPLTEAEARDVMIAVVDGLRQIHDAGLVHTSIDAKHVVAVGTRVQLASDTLCDADDMDAARADDVRALGALVYELLTTRCLEPGAAPELSDIGEPLRTVMRLCSEHAEHPAETLDQIADALTAPRPASIAIAPAVSARRPDPPAAPPPPPPTRPAERTLALPLLLPAVGAVIVALVLAITHRSPSEPQQAPAPPPPVATQPAPQPTAPVRAVPTLPVVARSGSWRVIAYTFSAYRDALKKARTINDKWPAMRAEVFTAKGQSHGPYLIAIGGRMSRAEAASLRKKAVAQGLAHDTYIQNYSN
jgi:hypothetical protein